MLNETAGGMPFSGIGNQVEIDTRLGSIVSWETTISVYWTTPRKSDGAHQKKHSLESQVEWRS